MFSLKKKRAFKKWLKHIMSLLEMASIVVAFFAVYVMLYVDWGDAFDWLYICVLILGIKTFLSAKNKKPTVRRLTARKGILKRVHS